MQLSPAGQMLVVESQGTQVLDEELQSKVPHWLDELQLLLQMPLTHA